MVAWGWGEEQREGSDHKGKVAGCGLGVTGISSIAMGVNISLNRPALAGDLAQLVEHLPSTWCPGSILRPTKYIHKQT